jgi:hypothetical protein
MFVCEFGKNVWVTLAEIKIQYLLNLLFSLGKINIFTVPYQKVKNQHIHFIISVSLLSNICDKLRLKPLYLVLFIVCLWMFILSVQETKDYYLMTRIVSASLLHSFP